MKPGDIVIIKQTPKAGRWRVEAVQPLPDSLPGSGLVSVVLIPARKNGQRDLRRHGTSGAFHQDELVVVGSMPAGCPHDPRDPGYGPRHYHCPACGAPVTRGMAHHSKTSNDLWHYIGGASEVVHVNWDDLE